MAYSTGNQSAASEPKDRVASRVELNVDAIKELINRIDQNTDRIIGHSRALGYYELPPANGAIAPTPVITTLSDAISAMDRAADRLSAALNVFD